MDASMKSIIKKGIWAVTALAAVCVGLGALGINCLEVLHLASLEHIIRYVVGICGVVSLAMCGMHCMNDKCC